MLAPFSFILATDPITPEVLARTIFFQVVIVGLGTLTASQGLTRLMAWSEVKGAQGTRAKRILFLLLGSYVWKGLAFLILTATTVIIITDIGWPPAFHEFGLWMGFVMARAGAAPNGAHLVSYAAVALFGVWFAWRSRVDTLLDSLQAIVLVGFLVAFHELPWLGFYLLRYYGQLGLFIGSNFTEDASFGVMCVLLVAAWWRYPHRTIGLDRFLLPLLAYSVYLGAWFSFGLPVTTINNFQIGQGPFEQTLWWADPWVNLIEIGGWLFAVALFAVVVKGSRR